MSAEIKIPVMEKKQRGEPPKYIVREIDKSMVIDLKDWFVQLLPPEFDGDSHYLSLTPRREAARRESKNHASFPRNT